MKWIILWSLLSLWDLGLALYDFANGNTGVGIFVLVVAALAIYMLISSIRNYLFDKTINNLRAILDNMTKDMK